MSDPSPCEKNQRHIIPTSTVSLLDWIHGKCVEFQCMRYMSVKKYMVDGKYPK